MFRKEFIEIIKLANKRSQDFYEQEKSKGLPNPFFVGFGNPNSDLLILGKEKGFDATNSQQLEFESIRNPSEWAFNIENRISFHKDKFYPNSSFYHNAFFPYVGKMKSGHTWNKYTKLTDALFSLDTEDEDNSFLRSSFISEINHEPSISSKLKAYNFETRLEFLKNDFYKSFKYIILGCGDYLNRTQIEELFDVEFYLDDSQPREKLVIYKNEGRTVINTRQLSMDVKNNYILKVAKHLKQ